MSWRSVLAVALLAGCAYGRGLVVGQSTTQDVGASMGKPTLTREHADGTRTLWYSKLPFGRENWAAVVDRNGVLVSFEQRLTDTWIKRIQPGKSTGEDLLDLLGPPYRRSRMPHMNVEVWDYPLWTTPRFQTLHIETSPDGMVQKLYKLDNRGGGSF